MFFNLKIKLNIAKDNILRDHIFNNLILYIKLKNLFYPKIKNMHYPCIGDHDRKNT